MVLGVAAALAGAAGVGVAWWQQNQERVEAQEEAAKNSAAGSVAGAGSAQPGTHDLSADAIRDFWMLSFDSPDGQPLAMASLRGKPLLVNFWATWCPPCIEELPLLDSFYRTNKGKGWQVLGLAVDQPSAVRQWLQRKPLAFPVGMAGFEGTQLVKSLGNASGSLPFSIVLSSAGSLIARKTGKVTPEELAQWAGRV